MVAMPDPLIDAGAALPALGSLRRQCLFAVTILLVEDSRSTSEAIRLFAAESGARVRRADSLHAASRHLAIYRPNVVMIDLGLPDGDGLALIRHLAAAATPLDAIVALSGHERGTWQDAAHAAGAAACLEKPIPSLRAFQEAILSVLPDADSRRAPEERALAVVGRASVNAALIEDLRRARGLLAQALPCGDTETVAYCAQFLRSVGDMLGDSALAIAAAGASDTAGADRLSTLLAARLDGPGRTESLPKARS
jgi:CheY-like chemotaxis protein